LEADKNVDKPGRYAILIYARHGDDDAFFILRRMQEGYPDTEEGNGVGNEEKHFSGGNGESLYAGAKT